MDIIQQLEDLDCAKVPRFSFQGVETYARVVSIHDPDTLTVAFKWKGEFTKLNVRLKDIDAPELKSQIIAESNACKAGIRLLKKMVENRVVRVVFSSFDKYGRPMVYIYMLEPIEDDITCINDYLLRYRYVRFYDGGKKATWTTEELSSVGTKI